MTQEQPPPDPMVDMLLEMERRLLGGILVDPSHFGAVGDALAADDFLNGSHGRLYGAMAAIVEDGEPMAATVLLRRAVDVKSRSAFAVFLSKLIDAAIPCSESVLTGYAREIKLASRGRRIAALWRQLDNDARVEGADPVALLEAASREVARLSTDDWNEEDPTPVVIDRAVAELHEMRARGRDPRILTTGLNDLDDVFRTGLAPGAVTIVAALTTRGKTTLAMQVADHVADRIAGSGARSSVLVFSMEMSEVSLHRRRLHRASEVPLAFFEARRDFRERGDELARLDQAAATLKRLPLRVVYGGEMTPGFIRSVARKQRARRGLSLVVVDYVGLVTPDEREENRQLQVAGISRSMKNMAMELDVPVLLIAQLNRAADAKPGHTRGRSTRVVPAPQLSHLRESGSLEQDADNVLMLHSPEENEPEEIDVIVRKQRNGPRDVTARLRFRGELFRFENKAHEDVNERRDLA